jgi:hypothetical protein
VIFLGRIDVDKILFAPTIAACSNLIGAGGASCGVRRFNSARRHPKVKSLMLLSEGTDSEGRQFLRNSPGIPIFLAAADDDPDPGVVEIMQWLGSLSSNPSTKLVRSFRKVVRRTIKTYRKVGAFYIACEEDFPTSIQTGQSASGKRNFR